MTEQTPTERLVDDAATHFALGNVNNVETAAEGDANRNYFVQTVTGDYVVKHVLEHSIEEVKTEAAYVERVGEAAFPVAAYLMVDGSPTYITEHDELVVAMPRIFGEHPKQTTATAKAIGAAFGYLHAVPHQNLPQRRSWLSDSYLPAALSIIDEHFPDDVDYRKAFESFDLDKLFSLPQSLIHGDMNDGNCIFENDQPKAFLDWEETSVGISLLDLAVCIQNFCYDGNVLNEEKMQAMVDSYEAKLPLNEAERSQMGAAIGYAGLTVSVWYKLQCELYNPAQSSNGRERLYWNRQLVSLTAQSMPK